MSTLRSALVTGAAGQDGVYLARRLIAEGLRVVGTVRPGTRPFAREVYLTGVELVEHDVRDSVGFAHLLAAYQPGEVYNLAGFSSVQGSWQHAALVADVNGAAVERMLHELRRERDRTGADIRFISASSAEILAPRPDSPYSQAKRVAHDAVAAQRLEHGLRCSSAVLYNHESPLRDQGFVTRKVSRAAAEIALGRRTKLSLGNVASTRDWGFAGDYVDALVRMARAPDPDDFVVATGVPHRLQDLVSLAFEAAGVSDPWQYVEQDPHLIRPEEERIRVGDPGSIHARLGWFAATSFDAIVTRMVAVDLRRVQSGVEEHVDYL